MLSSQERRIWQEIERYHAAGFEELDLPGLRPPPSRRPESRSMDDLPAVLVAGIWTGIG